MAIIMSVCVGSIAWPDVLCLVVYHPLQGTSVTSLGALLVRPAVLQHLMAVALGDGRLRPHVARTLQQLLQQGGVPVATGEHSYAVICFNQGQLLVAYLIHSSRTAQRPATQ
jgi:hypothetical protein